MTKQDVPRVAHDSVNEQDHDRRSLNEMLQELRVLQQGSQILTGFLILLPFSEGFSKIAPFEKWVYIVAFIGAIVSLVCFSAPAAQHRVRRPLKHRGRFKRRSTQIIIVGTIALSISLISTTQLVLNEVVGQQWSIFATVAIALLIAVVWWVMPLREKIKE